MTVTSGVRYQLEAGWRALALKPPPKDAAILINFPIGTTLPAGEIYCAIGMDGFRRLLIPVAAGVDAEVEPDGLGIRILRRELISAGKASSYVEVICRKPYLNGIFTDLCTAIVSEVVLKPHESGRIPCAEVGRWRDLLAEGGESVLSGDEILGLYAELLFLEKICSRTVSALYLWTGPDAARHDFTGMSDAVEVKATKSKDGRRFHINGLWQLELPPTGRLFLATLKVDLVPQGGDSIVDAVRRLAGLGIDTNHFWRQLSAAGYMAAHENSYAEVRFKILEEFVYLVGEDFPAITRKKFKGDALPPGIIRIEYDIDLTGKSTAPLPIPEERDVIAGLCG